MESIEKRKKDANEQARQRKYFSERRLDWLRLCQRGDMNLVKDSLGISRISVWQALHHGKGSLKMLEKIDGFFKERENALNNEENTDNGAGTLGKGDATSANSK